jgi:Leucine-rich repeat (LRR) protein
VNKNLYNLPLVLNVSHNCLTQLPRSITRLKNLHVLDLSDNQLLSLPENINDFEHLETVFLANNCLRKLPIGLVTLRELQHLDVRRNYLQALPPELESSKLKRPRCTSVPLQAPPILCPISKAKVLATQKSQDLEMILLTKAFKKFKS